MYVQYVVIDHSIETSAIFDHQDSTRTTSFLLRHADTINARLVIARSAQWTKNRMDALSSPLEGLALQYWAQNYVSSVGAGL